MRAARNASRAETGVADLPGLGSRLAGIAAIHDVLRGGGALDERDRTRDDAALARAIAVAAFRHFGTIRHALASRLRDGLPADPHLVAVFTAGAAQVLFLDTPDHAAVDLTVEAVRRDRRVTRFSGLVNAVLRRLVREKDEILAEADDQPLRDTPPWLAQRWTESYGPDATLAIAAAHRSGAAVDLTVKADPARWAERLGGVVLPTGSVRLASRTPIPDLPGFAEGEWWVQDAAAALPVRLLDVEPGFRVLDLCAAPGGKTAQLAEAGAHVVALDRSAPRLDRLRQNLARLRLAADIVVADAMTYEAEPFDAVLLDAPCTATGTIRRHPEIAWTKGPEDLAGLSALQTRLLDRAAGLVRPGGRLVYCVCSLEPEEGERQAEAFLGRHPEYAREPVEPSRIGMPMDAITPRGDLRTLPGPWPFVESVKSGIDGFYAVRLRRATS